MNGNAAGGFVEAVGAQVLHLDEDREDLADVIGEFGEAATVFFKGRPLAAALAAEEVVGKLFDGVAILAGAGGGHGLAPSGLGARSSTSGPESDRNGSAGKCRSDSRLSISGGWPRTSLIIAKPPGYRNPSRSAS